MKIKLLVFALVVFLSGPAVADSRAYYDHGKGNRILKIDEQGRAEWVSAAGVAQVNYKIDSECTKPGNNGMVETRALAYPYLLDLRATCVINDQAKAIQLLSRDNPPRDAFGIMYWGEDDTNHYSIVTGRAMSADYGYLQVKVVEKKTGKVFWREIAKDILDFSGGMWKEGEHFYLTLSTGAMESSVFELDRAKTWTAIRAGSVVPFKNIAQVKYEYFKGMSLALLVNATHYFYFNGPYESYLIAKADGKRTVVKTPLECQAIAPWKSEWMFLCNNAELKPLRL